MVENSLLIILGPTASGKTRLAVQLADALNGEIISADSRQVFKGMDIGTGKDLQEYQIKGETITHHLINIREAGESYQVDAFKEDFYAAYTKIRESKRLPVLCGGTGMYIHSLLQNHQFTSIAVNAALRERLQHYSLDALNVLLDQYPAAHTGHADRSTHKRVIRAIEVADYLSVHPMPKKLMPALKPLVIGLHTDVERRRQRIAERLDLRLEEGLIEEVAQLITNGVSKEILTFYGLEYKFVVAYLEGTLDLATLRERLFNAIAQYSKRQMTFFRKMEKDGVKIHWFDADLDQKELKREIVNRYLQMFGA
ncbi:tRNA (adenosine(37)-N6)-dimethylallyltransferase MiaA [Pedobacter sp. MC2016-14]|uniref:tRNA (adenosine(37)-N6)-dimethylallyltransferase MiaA n=1 Tax=Pedobacter sp. MC2016-14 TaxID=2897327 RepID=UPI001E46E4A4|nr:tRNA (adenosine(37)-N6)-dimethylallyltransferase MiaA [Pedobacter sp. MC2016-14]MCD0490155.1 tRNA (adenosine(37)-N6)-dimethylallyltransferase MiaA [Pedobacter sp. MC2016-14]